MSTSATREAAPAVPDAFLLEVSWEVCHQVGGIYQVLRSKAPAMRARWGDQYALVGPIDRDTLDIELEAEPAEDWLAGVLESLREKGVASSHGRWRVTGRPRVILLDHALPAERIEVIRHRMHRDHGVPPARGNELVDQVLGFGEAVRMLIETMVERCDGRRLLAQFHEWLGGTALPQLRKQDLPVATIFTTHATSIGRYVASSGENLYDRLPSLDAASEAQRYGIEAQHMIEQRCAQDAHVFTTVSPITGEECEQLLGRAPDMVTPNGLDLERFDLGHDFQTHHAQFKEQIHRFVMGHFFPSYAFDLERTLYLFNSGRFEPHNKGFDLCLEAMSRLNAELRASKSDLTVVFFIVTSREVRSFEPRALQARGVLDDLEEASARIGRDVGQRLFRSSAAGLQPRLDDLADDYWRLRHRRLQHAFASSEPPLLCTHVFDEGSADPILAHLSHLGLSNGPDDRVKIIYHPEFISPVNPLWGMDYEQFVRGCHLGIFPSCYEPWGYTPLECLAMGVPAVTSDLAGFGRYVAETFPDHEQWALQVLPRRGRSYHDAAADLTERVLAFCQLDRPARVALRNQAQLHSLAFDWASLADAYHRAHDLALRAMVAA